MFRNIKLWLTPISKIEEMFPREYPICNTRYLAWRDHGGTKATLIKLYLIAKKAKECVDLEKSKKNNLENHHNIKFPEWLIPD